MSKVKIMALGGLDEDGRNCYVLELDNDIFVIEAGIKYPESEQLGIEYIIPDFSYLIENADRVKGVFITHGHDDVMGALTFLLKEVDFDIYATPLTAKLLETTLSNPKKHINLLKRDGMFEIDGHIIHTFPVMQSIADGIGLVFETDMGAIVYTSEFIIDYDFTNPNFAMDIDVLRKLKNSNVLCLLSESVSATKTGYTTPKHKITDQIEKYFEISEGRIIVSLYSQNLFRIIELLELAKKYKRKVFFYNKEHIRQLKIVEDLGYYRLPIGIIVDEKSLNDYKDVVCVVSGSGNKVFRILNRIAIGEDRIIELNEQDTVIIASPIVSGTEKEAANMENDLYKAGVDIFKLNSKEVLSMHASKEDLKMMLYLIKPKYYLPVKGSYADLIANADIAVEMGYSPDKIVILDNGQFATFENGKLTSTHDHLELKEALIDGSDKTDVSGMVLKDRETLSTDGAIVLGVYIDFKTKEIIGGPDVQSRGVIYLKDAESILNEIGNILCESIKEAVKNKHYSNMQVRAEAKEKISRYVLKETGKKPMILPAIVEINVE